MTSVYSKFGKAQIGASNGTCASREDLVEPSSNTCWDRPRFWYRWKPGRSRMAIVGVCQGHHDKIQAGGLPAFLHTFQCDGWVGEATEIEFLGESDEYCAWENRWPEAPCEK